MASGIRLPSLNLLLISCMTWGELYTTLCPIFLTHKTEEIRVSMAIGYGENKVLCVKHLELSLHVRSTIELFACVMWM